MNGPRTAPPPGWGGDELTGFIELAHANRYATFVHKRAVFDRLIEIDRCFMTITKDWINPKGIVPAHLFLRAHAAFRAACSMAAAGQVAEVFPLVRTTLECAGYALFIHETPETAETWLRRHDDDTSKKLVRDTFTVGAVRSVIGKKNRNAGEVFATLYERAVDFGGHPNERAVTGNLTITERDDRREYEQLYLHGNGLHLDHALRTVMQAGVCALEILQEAFPARFELLGARADLLHLRQGL